MTGAAPGAARPLQQLGFAGLERAAGEGGR